MMKYINNKKGLTLIELLAALAIFSLIGTLMFSLIINAYKTFDDGMLQSKLVKEIEIIEMRIKQVTRNTIYFEEVEGHAYIFNSSSLDEGNSIFMWDEANTRLLYFPEKALDSNGDPISLSVQAQNAIVLSDQVTDFRLFLSDDNRKINYSIKLVEDNQTVEVNGTGSVFIPNWRN